MTTSYKKYSFVVFLIFALLLVCSLGSNNVKAKGLKKRGGEHETTPCTTITKWVKSTVSCCKTVTEYKIKKFTSVVYETCSATAYTTIPTTTTTTSTTTTCTTTTTTKTTCPPKTTPCCGKDGKDGGKDGSKDGKDP
ncbi:12651_t:CDS:2 [Ambispora leptoticha]|uniref:12651_t:CDS:1 n=1 Tax=Ambispora leptoticha TaxID=144679 RepID=A0A9N8V3V1_9GLOM|nr:12651_t:CDS:2 [Ambispora leptoticha]